MPIGVYIRTEECKRIHKEALNRSKKFKKACKESGRKRGLANFKGEFTNDGKGYIIKYCPDHPYVVHGKYVRYHRLVVEEYLGYYLERKWEVHHINEIRDDNRIENLMVFISKSAHSRWHRHPENVQLHEIIFDGSKME